MKKRHSRSGFTMAEMLIVVGIIVVLTGVSFIAVQRYQRSMAQLECEAVAKEIFVAAQNHLTMAESQGYLGVATAPGSEIQQEENETTQGIYYLVNGGSAPAANSLLELMLPFGSIDETVRARGSYLIRYQLKPATVLDVFYCSQTGKYAHKIEAGEYAALLAARDSVSEGGTTQSNKSARLNYGSAVLGWYGGTGNLPFGSYLDAPKIEVENAERLIVKISNVNKDKTITDVDGNPAKSAMKLIVTGEDSHACMSIALKIVSETNRVLYDNSEAEFIVVLDDITTKTESGLVNDGLHFADLNKYANSSISTGSAIAFMENEEKKTPKFLPGENITVYAVAYSNEALTNIAYSNEETTNSLFADYDAENSTAMIGNFRHLENLDGAVSGVMEKETGSLASVEITAAQQIVDLGELPESEESGSGASGNGTGNGGSGEGSGASGGGAGEEEVDLTGSGAGSTSDDEKDLSWTGFVEEIKKTKADNADVKVYALGDETGTKAGCYRPVRPSYLLTYKGGYTVGTGVTAVKKEHIIANVTVDGDGAAGLFGAPTAKLDVSDLTLIDFSITGAGDAGALAGTLANDSTVSNVLVFNSDIRLNDAADGDDGNDLTGAAAPTGIASTGGNAGGLIGSMTGGSVTGSAAALIVSSEAATGANAGGLIGSAANVAVTDSYAGGHTDGKGEYSTSAYNVTAASGTAGGLIGAASGTTTVNYCYSTCSVSGKVAGGLIGTAVGAGGAATESVTYSYAVGKTVGTDAQGTFLGGGKVSVTVNSEPVTKTKEDLDFVYAVDMDSEDLLMLETVVSGTDPDWKARAGAAPYDDSLGKKYIYPTVDQLHQMKSSTSSGGDDLSNQQTQPIHLTTHYGDWEEIKLLADADLALINAERLSAKITMPRDQIVDGGVITMLIRGETSHPIIDATNDAYDKTKDAYLVLMVTKPASEDGEYTLSLSPDSVVPGVEASKLQEWFAKLKKAGVGVQVPASDDAEIELNLDDITAPGSHFAQLFTTFIPGENISVAVKGGVVASDKLNAMVKEVMTETTKNSLTETDNSDPDHPVTRTVAARTNSLFADPKTDDYGDGTDVSIASTASASIANFRHLENLDNAISGVNAATATLKFTQAKQIVDLSKDWPLPDGTVKNLSWPGFIAGIYNGGTYAEPVDNPEPIQVYRLADTDKQPTGDGCFLPVYVAGLTYDGGYTGTDGVLKAHSITGVRVNTDGNAGLFGTLSSDCKVSNLELIDFSITSTGGNAGALAGVSNDADIANVLAHNTTKSDNTGNVGDAMTPTITAVSSAGGLVGNMTGGKVEQSAAALVVSSTGGNAGGLIGNMTGGEVTDSYSGGHTSNGAYDDGHFNVTATGNAGGLIGAASGLVTVDCCYSTCSASGTTAGSLIGASVNTVTVSHSYAVGKTSGTTSGSVQTFLGSGSVLVTVDGSTVTKTKENLEFVYAVDMDNDDLSVTTKTVAKPYDSALISKNYPYPTVTQLNHMADSNYEAPADLPAHVGTHYGDWGELPQLDVNLELINAERLSAKITLPAAKIADGGKLTMLIHGDNSDKDAYLVFKVTKPTTEAGAYALSLSSESTVPGVAVDNLNTTWFDAGIGTTTAESVDTVEIKLNLDDITAEGKHFTNLFPQFTPGENITAAVKGGVIAQTKLETIVAGVETDWKVSKEGTEYVIAARTNSLFADPDTNIGDANVDGSNVGSSLAAIANFRHLENLDNAISGVNATGATLSINKAVQIADLSDKAQVGDQPAELLSWTGFGSTIVNGETDITGNVKKIKIYKYTETTEETADGYFLPVNPAAIEYDGQGHSITGVVVNTAGEAGLFGALISDSTVSTVKNLELIDFSITSTGGNAGALAGVSNGATVTNVLARNSAEKDNTTTPTVTAAGSAGGLIGSMTGGSVTQSAAALVVSSSGSAGGDAGGLIGNMTGGTVSGSYSGGHTSGGAYSTTDYNVTAASGNAGGLIGAASGMVSVDYCYSTCSATGATAGGLVGTASGTFTNCYATGLVKGATDTATVGAFAGSIGSASNCRYFEAVNPGIPAAGGTSSVTGITELDADLATYKLFVGVSTTWTDAQPYDTKLRNDYKDKANAGKYLYNLESIGRLIAPTELTAGTFVATHYGDWPMPGILVNNTKNGG